MTVYTVLVDHHNLRSFINVFKTLEEAQNRFNELVDYYSHIHTGYNDRGEHWTDFKVWENAYTTEIKVVKSTNYTENEFGSLVKVKDSCTIYLGKHELD